MIPIKDENPTRSPAVVTLLLIAACVFVFFFVQSPSLGLVQQGPDAACADFEFNLEHAAIPYEITEGRPLTESEAESLKSQVGCPVARESADGYAHKSVLMAIVYSMFMHGGLLHLGGNMLYLWIFGNNIEDVMSKPIYIGFYLVSGLATTLAHVFVQPDSPIPLVGASGAIAGVMGAYLVLFPNAPIRTIVTFFFIFFTDVRAKWLLGFWFVSQFFINPNGGVAWMAHVGGFVFGAVVALIFRNQLRPRRVPSAFQYTDGPRFGRSWS